MGYYTRFDLEVKLHKKMPLHEEREVLRQIRAELPFEDYDDDGYWTLGGLMDGEWDSVKWYDHETDMRRISRKYPEHLFILSGAGAEGAESISRGDIWKKYFLNGKMQDAHAVITIADFDPKQLK